MKNKKSYIMIKRKSVFFLAVSACILIPLFAFSQSKSDSPDGEATTMIKQIYKEVSSEGDKRPDWELLRSFFVNDAIIVLRTSREGNTQFTLEEFIQDFKDFYQSPAVGDSGFKEEVIQVKSQVYHDIAFIGVVYEARILNSDRPPQKGVDFWLLARKGGSWKVVAVTNEIIPPGEALPEMFE